MSRRLLATLCVVAASCGQPPIDEGVPYVSAAARRARTGCRDPVYVDDLGSSEYAINGCGLLGVYRCSIPDRIARAGDRFGGVQVPARCEVVREGEEEYRRAVGAWAHLMFPEATRHAQTASPTVPREPTPTDEFASEVRAHLDDLATALLACGDRDVLAVRATWDGECGVSLAAPNVEREISECVAALAPTLEPSCAGEGRLLHVVRTGSSGEPATLAD